MTEQLTNRNTAIQRLRQLKRPFFSRCFG